MMSCWSLCNAGIGLPLSGRRADSVRLLRFVEQDAQRRKVAVPFDERRNVAEALQRRTVKIPDGVIDCVVMGVDENFAVSDGIDVIAREVNFAGDSLRYSIKIGKRVEAKVMRADVDVIDVEQQPAPG